MKPEFEETDLKYFKTLRHNIIVIKFVNFHVKTPFLKH